MVLGFKNEPYGPWQLTLSVPWSLQWRKWTLVPNFSWVKARDKWIIATGEGPSELPQEKGKKPIARKEILHAPGEGEKTNAKDRSIPIAKTVQTSLSGMAIQAK